MEHGKAGSGIRQVLPAMPAGARWWDLAMLPFSAASHACRVWSAPHWRLSDHSCGAAQAWPGLPLSAAYLACMQGFSKARQRPCRLPLTNASVRPEHVLSAACRACRDRLVAHRRLSEPMSSVGQRKPGRDQRRRDKAGRERRSDQERQVGGDDSDLESVASMKRA